MINETVPNIDTTTSAPIEPQPQTAQAETPPVTQTAQIPANEPLPLENTPAPQSVEPEVELSEPESLESTLEPESVETDSAPAPSPTQAEPVVIPKPNLARDLLNKARFAIQTRKRVKLDRIMTLFAKRTSITNDEVEKFLHVSDATATRYLEILEKENKIKQSGKTGKGVTYTKI